MDKEQRENTISNVLKDGRTTRPRRYAIGKEMLEQLLSQGVHQSEIARIYNLTQPEVSLLRAEYEIPSTRPRRTVSAAEYADEIVSRYDELPNIKAIVDDFRERGIRLRQTEVSQLLNDLGEIRSPSAAQRRMFERGFRTAPRKTGELDSSNYRVIKFLFMVRPSAKWIARSLHLSEREVQGFLKDEGLLLERDIAHRIALSRIADIGKLSKKKVESERGLSNREVLLEEIYKGKFEQLALIVGKTVEELLLFLPELSGQLFGESLEEMTEPLQTLVDAG